MMTMKLLSLFLGLLLFSSVLTNPSYAINENKRDIPAWIKNIASFWSSGQISDDEYLRAIQWLIDNGILKASQVKTNSIQDKGDFYAVYHSANDPTLQNFERQLRDLKSLEIIADHLNEVYKLPYDVPLIFSECGKPNAYYDLDKKEIVFCYELLLYYFMLFRSLGYDDHDVALKGLQVFFFVYLHELGHALIDVYDLPVTGMEEDAVDQLATIYITKQKRSDLFGLEAVKSIATWFAFEGVRESMMEQLPFWDEHSLNQQRLYNTLCWTYGSSPKQYSNLVGNDLLPQERAGKCPREHEKMLKSWRILLLPYVKDPSSSVLFND